jgi:cytochrome c oxidase subunit 4
MKFEQPSRIISNGTYVGTWVALVVLLAATIIIAEANALGKYSIIASIVIASVMAALVFAFFMHLKYESRFLKGMLFLAILAITAIIALTFTDVWYRYGILGSG